MGMSQEDNLIIQSYLTTLFLVELKTNNFTEESYFKEKMSPRVQKTFEEIGIDNQGCLLMFLYALLVIPRGLYEDKLKSAFDALNSVIAEKAHVLQNDYPTSDYVRHMRNSVSHATVEFKPNETVTFTDKNPKNGKLFIFRLPLMSVGLILNELQAMLADYYKN